MVALYSGAVLEIEKQPGLHGICHFTIPDSSATGKRYGISRWMTPKVAVLSTSEAKG
jgi:hypothetical protein